MTPAWASPRTAAPQAPPVQLRLAAWGALSLWRRRSGARAETRYPEFTGPGGLEAVLTPAAPPLPAAPVVRFLPQSRPAVQEGTILALMHRTAAAEVLPRAASRPLGPARARPHRPQARPAAPAAMEVEAMAAALMRKARQSRGGQASRRHRRARWEATAAHPRGVSAPVAAMAARPPPTARRKADLVALSHLRTLPGGRGIPAFRRSRRRRRRRR
jgi:hypothetical protein